MGVRKYVTYAPVLGGRVQCLSNVNAEQEAAAAGALQGRRARALEPFVFLDPQSR